MRVGFLAEAAGEGLDPEVAADLETARRIFRDAGRDAGPRLGPPRPGRDRDLLRDRQRRGVLQPRAFRRRALRPAGLRVATCSPSTSKAARAGFGPEVKRRILLGTFALASGYYEAYYGAAMRARQLLRDDFGRAFAEADVIVCPSIPSPAFRIGEKTADPLTMYLSDIFTVPASLAGLPAISVPSGLTRSGLPLGIQVIAPRFGEEALFSAARAFEAAAGFPDAPPPALA